MVKERKTNIDDMYLDEYMDNEDMNGKDLNDGMDIIDENRDEETKVVESDPNITKPETTEKLDVNVDEFMGLDKEEQEEIQQSKLNFVVSISNKNRI